MAGNWKMFKTPSEAVELAKGIVEASKGSKNRVMIAPSFVALSEVAKVVKGTNVELVAQNMASEEEGAHTGETSILMLKEIGVTAIILGHSERRTIYGEDDNLINTKVKLALSHGQEVILCIGETLTQREKGEANAVCAKQLEGGLKGITPDQMKRVVIAYEPVWAIGTGKTATPGDAQAVHEAIREKLSSLFTAEIAESTVIQYGGSVKPANVKELMAQKDINGALIGGASLEVDSFKALTNFND